MKKLGANVVRIHLQIGKFMDGPDKPNDKALDRLASCWPWPSGRGCTST